MKHKYYIKRMVIPSLKLDFDLLANEKDKDQLDMFINLALSIWNEVGKGKEIRIYDFLGQFKPREKEMKGGN